MGLFSEGTGSQTTRQNPSAAREALTRILLEALIGDGKAKTGADGKTPSGNPDAKPGSIASRLSPELIGQLREILLRPGALSPSTTTTVKPPSPSAFSTIAQGATLLAGLDQILRSGGGAGAQGAGGAGGSGLAALLSSIFSPTTPAASMPAAPIYTTDSVTGDQIGMSPYGASGGGAAPAAPFWAGIASLFGY